MPHRYVIDSCARLYAGSLTPSLHTYIPNHPKVTHPFKYMLTCKLKYKDTKIVVWCYFWTGKAEPSVVYINILPSPKYAQSFDRGRMGISVSLPFFSRCLFEWSAHVVLCNRLTSFFFLWLIYERVNVMLCRIFLCFIESYLKCRLNRMMA